MVKSNEKSFCPRCGGSLNSRDSRLRKLILPDGTKSTVRIRRFKCRECGKLHAELPDFIHPFRHYSSKSIQNALDRKSNQCPAEDSTIRRWIRTFQKAMDSIEAALISAWMQETGRPWELIRKNSLLGTIQKQHPEDWLAFVNRRLLTLGFGTYTQFAFCPEPAHDTLFLKYKGKGHVP